MARRAARHRRRAKSASGLRAFRRHWKWALIPLVVALGGVLYLDYVVRSQFEGKKWALPARVYARPLELYAGLPLRRETLVSELENLGYRFSTPDAPGRAQVSESSVTVHSRGFHFWDGLAPARRLTVEFSDGVISELRGPEGEPLAIARLEPQEIGGIYPAHMEDRLLLRLEEIPPLLGEALIAVEDRDFRRHHGISPRGIGRAALANLRAGRVVEGGSTLTQQLVKNFYLDRDRSFLRKSLEAIMAVSLDAHYDKAEILETFINEVYLGQSGDRAIHGFALGAQHYFRQPLAELEPQHIALLVGLIKGPSYYDPWRYPARARERRDLILRIMAESGLIDGNEWRRARTAPLGVVDQGRARLYSYPAFIDLVKRQLQRDYRTEDLQSEGLRVFTTLEPRVQRAAEKSLARRLNSLEADYPVEDLQGAMVVEAVGNGEVLAVVGDRDGRYQGFNRALDARRPIGSLVKPAVYLTALQRAGQYNLMTLLDDAPLRLEGEHGEAWEPRNFSRESHGRVPMYEALAQSYNQATARLGDELGVDPVLANLKALGMRREAPGLPSLLLGALSLSPLDVSRLYQTIASEGIYNPQRAILAVVDPGDGRELKRYPLESEQRFDADVMHLVQFALQHSVREGTGQSVYRRLDDSWQVAGKTGTSDQHRDSWFAGYSANHLAVVWLGRDDNGPTPFTGATGAMTVWADLFTQLASRSLDTPPPSNVDYHWVDAEQGTLGGPNCEGSVLLPFIDDTAPTEEGRCRHRENPVFYWLKDKWSER